MDIVEAKVHTAPLPAVCLHTCVLISDLCVGMDCCAGAVAVAVAVWWWGGGDVVSWRCTAQTRSNAANSTHASTPFTAKSGPKRAKCTPTSSSRTRGPPKRVRRTSTKCRASPFLFIHFRVCFLVYLDRFLFLLKTKTRKKIIDRIELDSPLCAVWCADCGSARRKPKRASNRSKPTRSNALQYTHSLALPPHNQCLMPSAQTRCVCVCVCDGLMG
jgi:hypothetical protein